MHRQYSPGSGRNGSFHLANIDESRAIKSIHEHRLRAYRKNRLHSGNKGIGNCNHLVAGAHSGSPKRKGDCVGAVRTTNTVTSTAKRTEAFFKTHKAFTADEFGVLYQRFQLAKDCRR